MSSENLTKNFILRSHESIDSSNLVQSRQMQNSNHQTGGYVRKKHISEIVSNNGQQQLSNGEILGVGGGGNNPATQFRRKPAKGSRDSCSSQISGMNNIAKGQLPNRTRPGQHFSNYSGVGAGA